MIGTICFIVGDNIPQCLLLMLWREKITALSQSGLFYLKVLAVTLDCRENMILVMIPGREDCIDESHRQVSRVELVSHLEYLRIKQSEMFYSLGNVTSFLVFHALSKQPQSAFPFFILRLKIFCGCHPCPRDPNPDCAKM